MCDNVWVDNGWYYGSYNDMAKAGLKFDPNTDVVFCIRLAEANWKIMEARWDKGEDYIPL